MATLVLTAAGQALGAAFGGPLGAVLGQAAGAIAGSAIDSALFGESRTVEGRRLADLDVQASSEGASIPLIYGRVRLAGQVIWATRFEEAVSEERQGGKGGDRGGASVRSYRYFANFAVALAQGSLSHVGRVWADGKPLDLSNLTYRVYLGSGEQPADPLISAKQGETSAYRHTAYVVFERLPLEPFGNRLPQLSFEVIRAADRLEPMVRAVSIIPGAGEFVYEPKEVSRTPRRGVSETENRHVLHADSNFLASLDELTALCPNLESVALVVAWFGDDLRAGQCTIRPKTENAAKTTRGATWAVSGIGRAQAETVSLIDGHPAYGGTPSDASVISAIKELKARGLRVVLYPFVLMDIAPGNALPDPYGGQEQAAYPWRGRITGSDGQAAAAGEIAAFAGRASPGDFQPQAAGVGYNGPTEWSYRRFILHYAHLSEAAGGVDAMLIGSEMRGLTRLGDNAGGYPFVEALRTLAGDVRSIVGGETKITYAADWSEYGSHTPVPGELRFPLDPLWADPAIDMVGIDNYLPIADQRDGGDPDGNFDPYDIEALRGSIAGGEYFDWYYASEEDRKAGTRTPITDGAYGKPFVFRAKDLAGWWANPHFERTAGVEDAAPTAWVPEAKPIWFTELGFPAVDKGANQPNVFPDPKSAESALPHFSTGARDDLMQRRALEAQLSWWSDDHPDFAMGDNPVSSVYGGPMVDASNIHLWSWDARPFPTFPASADVWADGANWRAGHWLNGRLGGMSLKGLAEGLALDLGVPGHVLTAENVTGVIDGIAVAGPASPRRVIEPLGTAFGATGADLGDRITLAPAWRPPVSEIGEDDLADAGPDEPPVSILRNHASDLAAEIRFAARDVLRDHRRFVVASRRIEGESRRVAETDTGAVADAETLGRYAEQALVRQWAEREDIRFALSPHRLDVEPGDILDLLPSQESGLARKITLRVETVEDGPVRLVAARSVSAPPVITHETHEFGGLGRVTLSRSGPAEAIIVDLPALPGGEADHAPRIAAFASPWPGGLAVYRGAEMGGLAPVTRIERPATMGELATGLMPGPTGRWDNATQAEVELYGGILSSRPDLDVLGGANTLVAIPEDGEIEIFQFQSAELIGERRYRLSRLLRGQLGTEAGANAGLPEGARVVLIDDAFVTLPLSLDRLGLQESYRIVPEGQPLDGTATVTLDHAATGRGVLPLDPVHLQASREADGAVIFRWIRRTRIGGDNWIGTDVPLGEEREAYEAEFLSPSGEVLATLAAERPELRLEPDGELSIFGSPQSVFHIRIHQISGAVGRGLPGEAELRV
ncbi:glycoside hydrolase TIM-barrel-like domain-containing protein [Rhizobiales bacterium]|uniref:baseplate multidomain protein megatron n=1 Tax=Hongsoonwoonella zoysiae TaxID=2821844 RepID=UPI0015605497|nr:glycoside hydrolase/phage tail family protein [Hongsoonwoonella zoysiae]NRG19384.1 glycoside hydrolase TIM-barrel-like domain-containing protein [Hongsoonwoonella zoysiae]